MFNEDDILTVQMMGENLIAVKLETGYMWTIWLDYKDLENTLLFKPAEKIDSTMSITKIEENTDFEVIVWSKSLFVLAKANLESRTEMELDFATKIKVRRTAHDDFFMNKMGYICRHQVKLMTDVRSGKYLTAAEQKEKLFFILFQKFKDIGFPKHIIQIILSYFPIRNFRFYKPMKPIAKNILYGGVSLTDEEKLELQKIQKLKDSKVQKFGRVNAKVNRVKEIQAQLATETDPEAIQALEMEKLKLMQKML